jgi:PD-(D/E)XK endonuclease
MSYQGINIRHAKQRGEWAELLFMARASEQGLCVTRPWGDSAAYDFAVEHKGRFLRIQVKSTKYKRGNSYKCHVSANGVPYRRNQLDFIAAYVIALNVWYIIPAHATHRQPHVLLSPHRPTSKYARYQEAWHLLRRER